MPLFVPDYDQLAIHKMMLRDFSRVKAFGRALEEVVTNESIVMDLGCGAGVLSLFAVNAGAKKVYAVERARISELARRVTASAPQIEVVADDVRFVERDLSSTVIVSECIGVHVFQENMISSLIEARKRFLANGGILIPSKIELWIAPLRRNPRYEDDVAYWRTKPFGLDLSEIATLSCNDLEIFSFSPDDLWCDGLRVVTLDLYLLDNLNRFMLRSNFHFGESGEVWGACGWFKAVLTDGVILDTSPMAPLTHWQQTLYAFDRALNVRAGETLVLELEIVPCEGYAEFSWRGYADGRRSATMQEYSTKNNYLVPR